MYRGEFIEGADFDLAADLRGEVFPSYGYNFYDNATSIVEGIESISEKQLADQHPNWQQVLEVARYSLGHVMAPNRGDIKHSQSDLLLEIFIDLYEQMDMFDSDRGSIFTFATVRGRRTVQLESNRFCGQIRLADDIDRRLRQLQNYLLPDEVSQSSYDAITWLNGSDYSDDEEQPSRIKLAMEVVGIQNLEVLHRLLRGWGLSQSVQMPTWEIARIETQDTTMVGEGNEHWEDIQFFVELFDCEESSQKLKTAIKLASEYLTETELAILTLYYGIDDNKPATTVREIASLSKYTELKISSSRVHQLYITGLAKITRTFCLDLFQGRPAMQDYLAGLKTQGNKDFKRQLNQELKDFTYEVGVDTIHEIIDQVTDTDESLTDEVRSDLNCCLKQRFLSITTLYNQSVGQFFCVPYESEVLLRIQAVVNSRNYARSSSGVSS